MRIPLYDAVNRVAAQQAAGADAASRPEDRSDFEGRNCSIVFPIYWAAQLSGRAFGGNPSTLVPSYLQGDAIM
jgi:hypothetical protein